METGIKKRKDVGATIKGTMIKGLSDCGITIESNQIEMGVIKISCDLAARPDNPQQLSGEMDTSEDFDERMIDIVYKTLEEKITEINAEERQEEKTARMEKREADRCKFVEEREAAIDEFEDGLRKDWDGTPAQSLIFEKKEFHTGDLVIAYLAVQFKEETVMAYAGMFRYLFRELLNDTEKSSGLFTASSYDNLFRRLPNRRVLFGNYVDYYLTANKLPAAEVLIELSAEKYEGSESEARIYFCDEEGTGRGDGCGSTDSNIVCTLDDKGKEYRIIRSENRRMIRKMMEISKTGTIHLLAHKVKEIDPETRETKDEYCQIMKLMKGRDDRGLYVKFSGFLCWSIVSDGKEEIIYNHGQYILNQSDKKNEYMAKIEGLKNEIEECVKESTLPGNNDGIEIHTEITKLLEEWFAGGKLERLIEALLKQKHGTSVILTCCRKEAERLCDMNRGTLLQDNSTMCWSNEEWDKDKLLGVTNIDGALFMDLDKTCIAMGVIVDGDAKKKGDVGKGARYNSVSNYVEQQETGVFLGIIVSEDGMVELTCNIKRHVTE
ncbi:MAG: hypothetical protein J6A08_12560 [Lachnospiraceae bacterium]|nr:hypothetical protein [Lachnospiraceae bacterium]